MYSSPAHAEKMRQIAERRYWEQQQKEAVQRAFWIGAVFGFAMGCFFMALGAL